MNFKPLLKYLEDEGVVQIGYQLGNPKPAAFKHKVPASIIDKTELTVLFVDGFGGTEVNHYTPGYFKTQFVLIVSCANVDKGEALIEQISALLTLYDVDLAGMRVKQCLPANLPVNYPVDDSDLVEHAVTFDIAFVIKEE